GWNFANQNLTNANFYPYGEYCANLTGATVAGAQFGGGLAASQLYSTASYRALNLQGISFEAPESYYVGSGADLTNADFAKADLANANLSNANLSNAIVPAILVDTNLTNANLANANLVGADVNAANLTGADLRGAQGIVVGSAFTANTI